MTANKIYHSIYLEGTKLAKAVFTKCLRNLRVNGAKFITLYNTINGQKSVNLLALTI